MACPGDPAPGQASPATTVVACVPSGGTAGAVELGDAVSDAEGVTDGTGGTGGTGGAVLSGLAGLTEAGPAGAAEITGPAELGALASRLLAGADGDTDGTDRAWLRWLEQPVAVAASTAVIAVITVSDVVRFTMHPRQALPRRPHARSS